MELAGGCSCGALRYRLTSTPLVVHACHCSDCQRMAGSAFVVNIWIEREFFEATAGAAKAVRLPTGSGKGQDTYFCAGCGAHIWSKYLGAPGDTIFVRAGTLDDPAAVAPDIHIHVRSKQPWFSLPEGVPAYDAFYDLKSVWPAEKLTRLRQSMATQSEQGR
jgi:hypothetical protein